LAARSGERAADGAAPDLPEPASVDAQSLVRVKPADAK